MYRLHKKLCETIVKQKRTDLTNGPSSAKIVPAQRIIHTLERLNFISQEVKRRIKNGPLQGKCPALCGQRKSPPHSKMMKREELSRIASVKFQKALSDRARAVTPRVLAFCVMAVSLVFTLAVTAANLRLTYVTDSDGARQLVVSSETDPARVMSLSGIEAEEGDHVYYTAFSGNLATLNIERAFTVNIQADGQEYPVKMAFGTVADALERAGITLEADDYTEPALDQLVTVGSEITVHRVDYQDKVETQTIPYDTQYVYTSLYFRNTGRATTLQHGAEGQQTVTTREKYVDGELENSMVVDVTTTVEPTDHVIKTYGAGAPVSPLTGPDGTTNAPASYSQVLTGKATGYYSRTGKGSSGLGLGYGTVAVDPQRHPLWHAAVYHFHGRQLCLRLCRCHRHRDRGAEGPDLGGPVL